MRFKGEANHGANAGLGVARDALEPIKQKFPAISYSDLWTLAGVYAIEYMGGPAVRFQREGQCSCRCVYSAEVVHPLLMIVDQLAPGAPRQRRILCDS